jgi:hypothetical protein
MESKQNKYNERLAETGNLIRTQDNRITDQPIFVVEKSVIIITDPDYGYDDEEWINTESGEYEKANKTKARRLDVLDDSGRETGDWKKFYLKETWEFVTACFTEKGCKDYLNANGHNLGKTRIYAYGSYRNYEYRDIRNYLIMQASV